MQILFCGRVRLSCILKEAGASVTQFLGRPNSNSLASSNLPYCEQALHPLDPEEEFLLGVMEKQIICPDSPSKKVKNLVALEQSSG
jgi:hypothetical protein